MICRDSVAGRLGYTGRRPLLVFARTLAGTFGVNSVLTTAALLQVARAFINPYKVLQVSEDADPSQIKRAYRKLALRLVWPP